MGHAGRAARLVEVLAVGEVVGRKAGVAPHVRRHVGADFLGQIQAGDAAGSADLVGRGGRDVGDVVGHTL